jgi:SAM-dependent MidA family methyltransferase
LGDNQAVMTTADSLTTPLQSRIVQAIDKGQGWLGFDDFMRLALYTPGLGYYANDLRKLGLMPGSGSDFVTAPELSPLFGRALMPQIRQALDNSHTQEVWEFGAGSGALAAQLLQGLGLAFAPEGHAGRLWPAGTLAQRIARADAGRGVGQ